MTLDRTQALMQALNLLPRLISPLLLYCFVTNLAVLISPLFMMQVLDRVVPSGNHNTLVMLLLLALTALAVNAGIEYVRDLSLKRSGLWLEGRCLPVVLNLPKNTQIEGLRNMNLLTRFVGGPSAISYLNLFWLPLFLIALILIHPLYLCVVAGVTLLNVVIVRTTSSLTHSGLQSAEAFSQKSDVMRQKLEEVSNGFHMGQVRENISDQLITLQEQRRTGEESAAPGNAACHAAAGFLRMAGQLFALSLGAYLISRNQISAGAMIGASIISSKTIGILEGALPTWRAYVMAKTAFRGLQSIQALSLTTTEVQNLSGDLRCNNLIVPRGGGAPPRLERISFELEKGACLAIIGGAGAGKSTLLQALSGLDPTPIGSVLLDETDVRQLGSDARRSAIGYLPQLAPVIPGSIGQIICNFDQNATDDAILRAARAAKVHGMISALPQGYQTNLAENPHLLTFGQRQQLGLAAALFHQPRYLFLDEPNALLDKDGERRLCKILPELKEAGTTIVMVLHRAGIIGLADQVMVLDRGRIVDFGPRSQVLGRQNDASRQIRLPLRPTSLQDLNDWISGQFTRARDAGFSAKALMLGTELFNAACLNGPDDQAREALITFTFIDDENCTLQLRVEGKTEADKHMPKIEAFLQHAYGAPPDFSPEELPLVLAAQIAEKLEVKNHADNSTFAARLNSDRFQVTDGKAH